MTVYLFKEEDDWWDRIRVDTDHFNIGRLPENHLEIRDDKVSRRHCRISKENGSYILEDLDSSNGTEVNNRKITSCEIVEGDIITVGDTRLHFSKTEDPPDGVNVEKEAFRDEDSKIKKVEELPEPYGLDDTGATPTPDSDLLQDALSAVQEEEDEEQKQEEDRLAERSKFFLLYQLGKDLNDELGLEGVLKTAIESIADVFDPRRCVALIIPSDQEELKAELGWVSGEGFVDGERINISRTVVNQAVEEKAAIISTDASTDPRFEEGGSIIDYNIDSLMCVPLWDQDSVIGALWVDSGPGNQKFKEEDLDLLSAIGNQLAIRIKQEKIFEDLKQEAILRKNLERFHSPDVVEQISRTSLEGDEVSQELEESEVSILFADIERFTKMAEQMPPRDVASMLSNFYESTSQIVFDHDGGVSKYIGDQVMAVFGAPVKLEEHAEQAVRAGKKIIQRVQEMNEELSVDLELHVRVGVNTGKVVLGYVGSKEVKEFTVLGDPVNVAARLEEIADTDEVLVGNRTEELLEGEIELTSIGSVPLEGREQQMDVYRAPIQDKSEHRESDKAL